MESGCKNQMNEAFFFSVRAHTYMGGGDSLSSPQSFFITQGAFMDGLQIVCTRLGGDAVWKAA